MILLEIWGIRELPIILSSGAGLQFSIKKQPKENYLSTLELTYYLIGELQKVGVYNSSLNVEGMMNVFKKMVNFQIACRKDRIGDYVLKQI